MYIRIVVTVIICASLCMLVMFLLTCSTVHASHNSSKKDEDIDTNNTSTIRKYNVSPWNDTDIIQHTLVIPVLSTTTRSSSSSSAHCTIPFFNPDAYIDGIRLTTLYIYYIDDTPIMSIHKPSSHTSSSCKYISQEDMSSSSYIQSLYKDHNITCVCILYNDNGHHGYYICRSLYMIENTSDDIIRKQYDIQSDIREYNKTYNTSYKVCFIFVPFKHVQ